MNLTKINEDIHDCEGVILDKSLYVREDEVLRLILKYAYNIEYIAPKETTEKNHKL